jgi:hypothetical protein
MGLARARPADEHHIVRGRDEVAAMELAHQGLIDFGLAEIEAGQIPVCREACRGHLIGDGTHLPLGGLGGEQFRHPLFGIQIAMARAADQLRPALRHAVELQRLQARDQISRHGLPPAGGRNA